MKGKDMSVIDKAKWQYDSALESYCEINRISKNKLTDEDKRMVWDYASNHITMFVTWLAINKYLSDDHYEDEVEAKYIEDLIDTDKGYGVVNVLAADKLMMHPKLYSTFLLWLMTELYSRLPEVGDMELPKLVFFFDEAHLLFDDAPKALIQKIEQVVKLIDLNAKALKPEIAAELIECLNQRDLQDPEARYKEECLRIPKKKRFIP